MPWRRISRAEVDTPFGFALSTFLHRTDPREMTSAASSPSTLDELRAFVHATLCAKENLLPEESRMQELVLFRDGRACGLQFFVHGPRLVRLGAIWTADQNTVYLYDARGERYDRLPLARPIPFDVASDVPQVA
jgi:hypothetical protein